MKNILFVLMALAFVSCKKGKTDFKIVGKVNDITFSNGMANTSVEIYKASANSTSPDNFKTITTDAAGNFTIDIKRDQFSFLEFIVSKDGYFTETKRIYFKDLSVESDNNIALDVNGKGWVKVRFLNQNDNEAIMKYYNTEGKFDCAECCVSGMNTLTGLVDTTYYCVNNAGKNYQVKYAKSFTSFNGLKNIITPFQDTVEILIEY